MVTKSKKTKTTAKKAVVPAAPVRKAKAEKKEVEEVVEEELVEEEEFEEQEEEEVDENETSEVEEEEDINTDVEILGHFKKNKGGAFWLTKQKVIKSEQTFWWPKNAIPKAFSDLLSVVEDTLIKSHRDYLGKGVFEVEEVKGGCVIINTMLDQEVSEKLSKSDAIRICKQLNA